MDKKKREKMRSTITKTQSILYGKDFKSANRAAGFKEKPF